MSKEEKHTHGFKVPEDYFQHLENDVFLKIDEERLPKETGFTSPEGYFKELEDRIMANVAQKNLEVKVVPIFNRKRITYGLSIAASLAMILTFVFQDRSVTSIDDIQISSIQQFLEEDVDWNSYDLAAVVTEEDFSDLDFDNELISEENIEDYLLDSIDEISILIEQE